MGKQKPIEILIEWKRWTIGIAWDYQYCRNFNDEERRFELSIQIPIIALSILIEKKS